MRSCLGKDLKKVRNDRYRDWRRENGQEHASYCDASQEFGIARGE